MKLHSSLILSFGRLYYSDVSLSAFKQSMTIYIPQILFGHFVLTHQLYLVHFDTEK